MVDKQVLTEILKGNQLLIENTRVIKRDFSFIDDFRYVFVGVRRAGKSFLMFQRIQELLANGHSWNDILYLNFEDDRLLGFDTSDFEKIIEAHIKGGGTKPILFLDEIQNIDGWEKFARRLADQKYVVYITGSNAKMLSTDVATTLGGRYVIKNVFPYNFSEFANAKGIDPDDLFFDGNKLSATLDEYVQDGGFPECVTFTNKKEYLISLYQKIFLGDIALRNKVENPNALRLMFKKMAESVMQPIALTRLTNIIQNIGIKVSKNTILSYANYAKDAFLILPMQNFADNFTGRETNQKFYFVDNGVIGLLATDCLSAQLENLVAVALLRKYGIDRNVFFYNYNVEVDFVIPEMSTAIQVCYTLGDRQSETYKRETTALTKLAKRLAYNDLVIITYGEEDEFVIENKVIQAVPIWKWLLKMK